MEKHIDDWDSVYREKTKKGYKDISKMVAVEVKENKKANQFLEIETVSIRNFVDLMRKYTDDLLNKTYSVKADNVSRKQIEEAQLILNELSAMDYKEEANVNDKLIELYAIIPRYMNNVRKNLLPNIDINKALVQEQDNLDAMSSQVSALEKDKENKVEEQEEEILKTYLEEMNIDMLEANEDGKKNFQYILDQLGKHKIDKIFEDKKSAEDERFDNWLKDQKDIKTRYLIRGTRCTSVIPILREGLKIRPSGNIKFSGKAYGEGNYFSEHAQKSLNYTGYDKDQILLVYEVHTGNPYIYEGWFRGNPFKLTYSELNKKGFDSTYVKPGNGLLNSEIIAYREEQARIKYIIHIKK